MVKDDWIYSKIHKRNLRVFRDIGHSLLVVVGEDDVQRLDYKNAEPIKLTPEILLANGFQKNKNNWTLLDYTLVGEDDHYKIGDNEVTYVSDLQHLLNNIEISIP